MKKITKVLRYWIPLAIAITGLSGLIYLTVQQSYRQSANDPQIQMAQDASENLGSGAASPDGLNSLSKIDVDRSLSPFYIVFDKNGKVLGSDALLNGKTPVPPAGVFSFLTTKAGMISSLKNKVESKTGGNENRFTWEPENGVRIAAVVIPYKDGYVLTGRNLREVENREESLTKIVFFGWGVTLLLSFIGSSVFIKEKS